MMRLRMTTAMREAALVLTTTRGDKRGGAATLYQHLKEKKKITNIS